MAYSTPPTKVLGDSAPAGDWNIYIRANFIHFADIHDHGSADHGAQTIGGTGGAIYARFTDAAVLAAPGAGKTQLYSVSGKTHQRAGAAGVDEELDITTHSHTAVQDVAPSEVTHSPNALSLDPAIARDTGSMGAPADITTMTDSISPSVSARIWSAAAHYSECTLDTAPSSGSTYWQLIIDGTVAESISRTNASISVGQIYEDTLSGEKDVSSGVRTITTHIDRNSEGNNSLGFKYMGMLISGAMKGQ